MSSKSYNIVLDSREKSSNTGEFEIDSSIMPQGLYSLTFSFQSITKVVAKSINNNVVLSIPSLTTINNIVGDYLRLGSQRSSVIGLIPQCVNTFDTAVNGNKSVSYRSKPTENGEVIVSKPSSNLLLQFTNLDTNENVTFSGYICILHLKYIE